MARKNMTELISRNLAQIAAAIDDPEAFPPSNQFPQTERERWLFLRGQLSIITAYLPQGSRLQVKAGLLDKYLRASLHPDEYG